jgi:ATP-binding cassette subfamily B (MDR/TAP) protein 1
MQATGVRLGLLIQAMATLTVGLIIALYYSWKYALFIFGVMPFAMLGAVMQVRLAKGFAMNSKSQMAAAGKVRIYKC